MQTYSIKLKCPSCGKEFYERRLKPYKYRITKMCPICKDDVDRLKVKVVGGKGDKSCQNCIHFDRTHHLANKWWGKCHLGRCSDDHEEPENIYGLVYIEDICDGFES